jgi:ABC-type nitrate/sulfonate/bicarbonate transport system permease component
MIAQSLRSRLAAVSGVISAGWSEALIGPAVLIGVWELMTAVIFPGRHVVPAPSQVVAVMFHDGFYLSSLETTLSEAIRGWLLGNAIALAFALLALFFPRLSRTLQQFGTITYCIPTVAIGPLILILAGSYATKVVIAALSVFFVSLIAWMTGLRAVDRLSLDLVRVYGGGRLSELLKVRLRSALRSASGGLALSAPAAVLGAMLGDYMGGVNGLGVAMLSAEESFQVSRTWSIGIVATAVSGLAYGLIVILVRRLGGDPQTGTITGANEERPGGSRRSVVATAGRIASPFISSAMIVAIWALVLKVFDLSSYFAKTPSAVWAYLFVGPSSTIRRNVVFQALEVTLRDAMLGWVVGTVAAIVAAALLVQFPRVRGSLFPIVMTLRSVPLIAMTPLIALIFGQGVTGVAMIAAIVTFVPSVVLIVSGLESVPPQAIELGRVYNLSGVGSLVLIRARYATPSIFAAAKISMPGAILGAILAEWLITRNGIGHLIAVSLIDSEYGLLWASVVVASAISMILYEVVGGLEMVAQKQLSL